NPPTGRLGIVHSCLQQRPPPVPSQIPQPGGWGLFIPAYNEAARGSLSNPPTGRLGMIHSSLHRGRPRFPLKSPNRKVGDCSFLPTTEAARGSLSNPPTGRLGIVHSCLQQRPPAVPSQIPQPGGWGLFIPAYNRGRPRFPLKSPNREVGDCSFLPRSS